ncbi:MFS transporter [Actinoplanes sp. NPDC026619]|uniref:MFS transporter n=1 Tax=Actinoplanes sp. NPDC026619 TaxID=3155798 RepID=UPI0034018D18
MHERWNLARYSVLATSARLADEGARAGLILLAIETAGSPGYGGLLVAALMIPHVVAAPVVGALADTVTHRKAFGSLMLVLYAVALALAALTAGRLPAVVAVLAALTAGCAGPFLAGGLTGMLADLAPTRLRSAYGLDSTLYGVAGILGPALTAVLTGVFTARVAVLCLAGAAASASLLVWSLPLGRRAAATSKIALGGVVQVFVRSPALGSATVASSLGFLGMSALPIAAALLAGEAMTGIVLSVSAAGLLAGSLLYVRVPLPRWAPENAVLLLVSSIAVPFAVAALFPHVPAVNLPAFALAGVCNGLLLCSLLVVRDRAAPPALHTQVFTVGAGVKSAAGAAGAALAGACAGLGAPAVLAGIAFCHVLAAALGAVVLKPSVAEAAD